MVPFSRSQNSRPRFPFSNPFPSFRGRVPPLFLHPSTKRGLEAGTSFRSTLFSTDFPVFSLLKWLNLQVVFSLCISKMVIGYFFQPQEMDVPFYSTEDSLLSGSLRLDSDEVLTFLPELNLFIFSQATLSLKFLAP